MLADCYQVYGLDIRGLEDGTLDPDFVGSLVSQLPRGSRVWEALGLDCWDLETWLLSNIDYSLRCYLYGLSDKSKGPKKPEPLLPIFTKTNNTNSDIAPQTIDVMQKLAALQLEGGG